MCSIVEQTNTRIDNCMQCRMWEVSLPKIFCTYYKKYFDVDILTKAIEKPDFCRVVMKITIIKVRER